MVGVYAGSNRMRVEIIVLGALLCSAATAEPQYWMKKEDPETLHSAIYVSPRCDFTQEKVRQIVDGVLIRSRLKTGDYLRSSPQPGDYFTNHELFGFHVAVECGEGTPATYNATAQFIRHIDDLGRSLLEPYAYGYFGAGESEDVLEVVKEVVEELVTDYLQANFDLTPE